MKRISFLTVVIALLSGTGCFMGDNPHEERGDDYFKAGRYDDAFAEYAIVLRQKGGNEDLYRKMGKTGILRKDLKGTREAYFSLLKLSPEDADKVSIDFFRLGVAFHDEGDIVQMADSFESLFDVDSTYNIGEYFYYLADYYYSEADFEKAIVYYTRALGYRPEHEIAGDATFRLALSNEKMESFRDALLYYEQFIHRFSDHEDVGTAEWHRGLCALNVAQEHYDRGDLSGALETVRIPISTGQPQVKIDDAWFLLGEIFMGMDHSDSALVAYEKVLELNPSRTGRLVSLSLQRIRDIKFGK
jgi:tetratricopeptide (TPR) repeat protein